MKKFNQPSKKKKERERKETTKTILLTLVRKYFHCTVFRRTAEVVRLSPQNFGKARIHLKHRSDCIVQRKTNPQPTFRNKTK